MDVPKPMLNSPAEGGTDAANAFFRDVERRVHESREPVKLSTSRSRSGDKTREGGLRGNLRPSTRFEQPLTQKRLVL
jgi:hypothetical protein